MRRRVAGWWPPLAPARLARPSSRGIFRVAAVALAVVAAGVTAGSAPAASQQTVSLSLGYTCAFPSASRLVSVHVTATFPASATAGQPIQPAATKIAVALPHAAVTKLARLNSPAVTLTAGLETTVTEGTRPVSALWAGFLSPATAVPSSGAMTLTASGTAPQFTGAAPGTVTIAARGLSLLFAAGAANGQPASTASQPASPSALPVVCAPVPGQNTTLASIAVARAAGSPGKSRQLSTASAAPADNPARCLPFPKGLELNPLFPLPKPPARSNVFHQAQRGCSYAAGFTNAAKLNEAVLVGPGLTDLRLGLTTYTKFVKAYSYFQQNVAGQLEYHGLPELPPVRATLLAFGFMPVSATLQISEIGSLNAALISCLPAPKHTCPNNPPNIALFYGRISLRIYNVSVNGVPLNVGADCRTTSPFNLVLTGVPPAYNVSQISGVLTGTVTVPTFTGCANGTDNLDPIFDATVSGPGNFAKITQAPLCTPTVSGHPGCPPAKPIPKH